MPFVLLVVGVGLCVEGYWIPGAIVLALAWRSAVGH